MDWLDLLEVQGILKSLLQQYNSKAPIPCCSAFFIVQLLHPYGEVNGNPLQYSCLENPMEEPARLWSMGVAKSRTRLSDFTFTFHYHALEKKMTTPSSILAWRVPGTGEPGGLPSMGSHRVRHDWSDLAAAAAAERLQEFEWLKLRDCAIWTEWVMALSLCSLYCP